MSLEAVSQNRVGLGQENTAKYAWQSLKGRIPVITKLTVTGRKDQEFVKTRSKFWKIDILRVTASFCAFKFF